MKCGLCNVKPKNHADLRRHVDVVHRMSLDAYRQAIRSQAKGSSLMVESIKRMGVALILAVVFVGCTQYKKLTGQYDEAKTEDVSGVWGGQIVLDGEAHHFGLLLSQSGDQIITSPAGITGIAGGGSFASIDYSKYGYVRVSGSVSKNSFTLTGSNGTKCPNPWLITGYVDGPLMIIHVQTDGNDVAGTACYPNPIDAQLSLQR